MHHSYDGSLVRGPGYSDGMTRSPFREFETRCAVTANPADAKGPIAARALLDAHRRLKPPTTKKKHGRIIPEPKALVNARREHDVTRETLERLLDDYTSLQQRTLNAERIGREMVKEHDLALRCAGFEGRTLHEAFGSMRAACSGLAALASWVVAFRDVNPDGLKLFPTLVDRLREYDDSKVSAAVYDFPAAQARAEDERVRASLVAKAKETLRRDG